MKYFASFRQQGYYVDNVHNYLVEFLFVGIAAIINNDNVFRLAYLYSYFIYLFFFFFLKLRGKKFIPVNSRMLGFIISFSPMIKNSLKKEKVSNQYESGSYMLQYVDRAAGG